MKIMYEEGPDVIEMGIAGQFRRGEPKEVDNKIAEVLLKKKSIIFKRAEKPKKEE